MSQSDPSVTVVVVNFNGGQLLLHCLASLQEQGSFFRVLVIDNASVDGSARRAYETYPEYDYLPLRRNVGFARAVNIAADRIESDVMVLLNPDTLAHPGFVEEIVRPLTLDSDLGAVAGTLVFEKSPDTIASGGIDVHRNGVAIDARLGEPVLESGIPEPVFGASGGAAAYRRQVFLDVGGFPSVFFMYLEDVDLAWRLRLQGWKAVWTPKAVVEHTYSASAGEGSAFKNKLIARNRIWMLVRCVPNEFWRRDGFRYVAYDAGAFGYGLVKSDIASVRGRAEAMIRILPRLCERRDIQRSRQISSQSLEEWVKPALSPRRLIELRKLTTSLAGGDRPV